MKNTEEEEMFLKKLNKLRKKAQKEALSSKEKTYKKAKRKKDSDNRPVAFHPFSPQEPEAHESNVYNHSSPTKGPPHHNRFNLYNNFVASSETSKARMAIIKHKKI
ncbi:hypothetical protein HELRODRAFT_173014 [Helobdella robusta]|uniref:Uncharacterized protein n=1 Tax=Helobdella robusta TaxID=6412 RepID=T1F697_HELRO|nr:hypothetical protein HELRODRAFT_173014 [Helobdella robusta]ESO03972.1 hypothetical protein HELRODRAFT_173014 [Helobdella robusta]